MDKPMSDLAFWGMSLFFKIRDLLNPPASLLKEAGIGLDSCVLDYGCGPGGYSLAAAGLASAGKVYALDVHPLAVRGVQKEALKRGLANVEAICSGCATGLPGESIDVVLLYDVLHGLGDPGGVLEELYRVLKPGGILSFSDHHMEEGEIRSRVTGAGLFRLLGSEKRTYRFSKVA